MSGKYDIHASSTCPLTQVPPIQTRCILSEIPILRSCCGAICVIFRPTQPTHHLRGPHDVYARCPRSCRRRPRASRRRDIICSVGAIQAQPHGGLRAIFRTRYALECNCQPSLCASCCGATPSVRVQYCLSFTDDPVRDFLSGASADPEHPILLFTHVPLSRPADADCGPLRERGTIREGRGLGYQNLLSAQASLLVLQSLRPAIVFR